MSMPVTSSWILRNGVEEGHEPAQMPQLAHRSGSTWAISAPGLPLACATMVIAEYGQSSKQRSQPLQCSGCTSATGSRRGAGRKGGSSNSAKATASSAQTNRADVASTRG